jgi:hypothetical protein
VVVLLPSWFLGDVLYSIMVFLLPFGPLQEVYCSLDAFLFTSWFLGDALYSIMVFFLYSIMVFLLPLRLLHDALYSIIAFPLLSRFLGDVLYSIVVFILPFRSLSDTPYYLFFKYTLWATLYVLLILWPFLTLFSILNFPDLRVFFILILFRYSHIATAI